MCFLLYLWTSFFVFILNSLTEYFIIKPFDLISINISFFVDRFYNTIQGNRYTHNSDKTIVHVLQTICVFYDLTYLYRSNAVVKLADARVIILPSHYKSDPRPGASPPPHSSVHSDQVVVRVVNEVVNQGCHSPLKEMFLVNQLEEFHYYCTTKLKSTWSQFWSSMLESNYLYWLYLTLLWINSSGINNVVINEKFNFFNLMEFNTDVFFTRILILTKITTAIQVF